jgi:hypothetical protein
VPKNDETGSLSGWIEALGVDSSYQPPADDRPIKPVACFYVLYRDPTQADKSSFYRAVYLTQRNLREFRDAIAAKWNLEPTRILRIIRVLDRGLEVELDDDVIRELSEGQDLIMEIAQVKNQSPVKREWDISMDIVVDSDNVAGSQNVVQTEGYEIRLMF